jgi:hypothetical protein
MDRVLLGAGSGNDTERGVSPEPTTLVSVLNTARDPQLRRLAWNGHRSHDRAGGILIWRENHASRVGRNVWCDRGLVPERHYRHSGVERGAFAEVSGWNANDPQSVLAGGHLDLIHQHPRPLSQEERTMRQTVAQAR